MNRAYIDAQNLQGGTHIEGFEWDIDFAKFRRYLTEKYNVGEAYYFFGYVVEENQYIYTMLQRSGFILQFRDHTSAMRGRKKGNVDTDIVLEIMKSVYLQEDFDKVVLVSGDGDYYKLVRFLVEQNKFEKLLSPNQQFLSSLYRKNLSPNFYDILDRPDIKKKIATFNQEPVK